ncbi:tyrosine-type recombinase/integrase [Enterococcus hulanensis]|uniref:tyrosine-type recombinase/integrase n=1 Tax=Enterococcus hulanensis TaxID=2559929 RepID=UPI001A8F5958|nr:tyrosine-type recombinase/integrase [Enterococcus hulanensis]MBO0458365.1 tyrosine-type recombinase/integrase [Enterococcus hulanensis]
MEARDIVINTVIRRMEPELNNDQLKKLKVVLTLHLGKFRLEEEKNELVIYDETSDIAAYKQYFVSMKLKNLSNGTIELGMRTVDKFMRWIRKPYADITTWDIKNYLAHRTMVDRLASSTLERERGTICRFFKWLYDEEYLPKDIGKSVEKIQVEKRLRHAFTPVELELLRNACRKPKERAVIEMLMSTGCRVSELVSLTMENYDPIRGEITVIGKGNKERAVYFNAKAKVAVDNYLKVKPHDSGPILCGLKGPGTAMTANGIQKMIKEIAKRANVTKAHPHKFRRTSATFAINQDMDINDVRIFLGHEDIKTTQHYIDNTGRDFKAIHNKYVA